MENENFKNSIKELHEVTMTIDEKKQIFNNIVNSRPVAVKSPWSFGLFFQAIERSHLATYVILFILIFVTGSGVVFDILSNKNRQTVYNNNQDVFQKENNNFVNPSNSSNNITNDSINDSMIPNIDDKTAKPELINQVNSFDNTKNDNVAIIPPSGDSSARGTSLSMMKSASPIPSPKESILSTWVWQKAILYSGETLSPKNIGDFTLTFQADNKVAGNTDCNGFVASYFIDESSQLNIGPLATTLMYCEGSQEGIFTDYVSKSSRYQINATDNNLIIYLENNLGYLIFVRQ